MFIPLLVKLLGALVLGGGLLTLQHPEVAKSAIPSVGIVLVEHLDGAQTSGTVFVAGDHLLMTADHEVQKAGHIRVRFRDTEWLEAKVVASDPITDVVVLSYSGPDLPPLPLADFDKVKPGDYVAVMAFPSIEELRKQVRAQDLQEKAAKAQTAVEGTVRSIRGALLVITTDDVPRNGGPVLNLKGEVVGIVRGRLEVDTPGLAYAAPSYIVKPTLASAELKRPSEPAAASPTAAQASGGSTPASSQPATSAQPQSPSSASSAPAASGPSQPAGSTPSDPATPAPSQPGSQAPSQPASAGPSQPAAAAQLSPAAASSTAVAPFLIVPGQSLGVVRLGMPVAEGTARLGASKGSVELEDGTTMYRWFEPPNNSGIGVRTAKNGVVMRVWVLNDERYRTKEGLHVGSTEAEVRSALGVPTRVEFSSRAKTRTLIYESLGLWFGIQLDQQYNFFNAVFDIGVMAKK